MPTMTFLMQAVEVGRDFGRNDHEMDRIKRNAESAVTALQTARSLGVKIMAVTDSGNSPLMPYGDLHAIEAEIFVRHGGYTPMEAIVACTKNSAFAVGLEDDLGVIAPDKLADVLILDANPLEDIRVLQGGKHLTAVIKDGRIVDLNGHADDAERLLEFQDAAR